MTHDTYLIKAGRDGGKERVCVWETNLGIGKSFVSHFLFIILKRESFLYKIIQMFGASQDRLFSLHDKNEVK